MKNIFLVFGVIFLAACSQPEDISSITLSGTIENTGSQPVEFVYYLDYTNNHRQVVTLEPGGQNSFSETFYMPEAAMGTLRHGRNSIRLFLQPGDDLHIEADAEQLIATVRFNGTAAGVNTCYVEYQREVESEYSQAFFSNAAKDSEPEDFTDLMEEVAMQKLVFMQHCREHNELTPEFDLFFQTEVMYDKYSRLLAYPSVHQRLNQMDELPEISEGYYNFLSEALSLDDRRLNSQTYVGFMLAYLNYQSVMQSHRFEEDLSANEVNYILAGELLAGHTAEYVQAITINREFNYGDLEKAQTMYHHFMETSQVTDYQNRVTNTWEAIQALMPGNPAPGFTMTDIEGNQVSLRDFHGKVVYLKFWASWCGPCMRQVPPAARLKERMAGNDDLVFVYVSIDADPNDWQNAVERNNISGVHFNTPGRERGVPNQYQVKWIPAFFIIGRDGNIFDNRPPQPSDENIDQVLMQALSQDV